MTGKERKVQMTQEEASRMQSAEAKRNDGKVAKGSPAALAQSEAYKNATKGRKRRRTRERWVPWVPDVGPLSSEEY